MAQSPPSPSTSGSGQATPLVRTVGPKSVLILAVVGLAGGGAAWYFSPEKPNPVVFDDDSAEGQTLADLRRELRRMEEKYDAVAEQLPALRSAATSRKIERDEELVRLARLRYLEKAVRSDLQALTKEHSAWKTKLDDLMKNDLGRKIAADPERVSLFASIMSGELVSKPQLESWQEQIELMFRTVGTVDSEDETISTTKQYVNEANALAKQLRVALQALRQQRAAIEGMLAELSDAQPGSGGPSLGDALSEHRRKAALAFERDAVAAAEPLKAEYLQKYREAKKKTIEAVGEAALEIERQRRELRTQLKGIEADKIAESVDAILRQEKQRQAELQAKLQRETLEAKFNASLPEIRKYLVPFISKGHQQLNGREWLYTEEQKPLSLGAIRGLQALSNDQASHQSFYRIAGWRQNDRPNGVFADFVGGAIHPPKIPDVVRAQTLLNQFGDLLVEKEMLEP